MKTPRELLLARHAGMKPELDAIRARAVAGLAPKREDSAAHAPATWLEFLASLRWHAAILSAIWLFAILPGREHRKTTAGTMAGASDSPPPLAYVLALREYSRQFSETADPPPRHRAPLPVPHAWIPAPRREEKLHDIA